ncbi:transcriptional regulator [Salipaludibacillus neizhouensis]|uniref:Transcriptional regulator n=1 Tax=Salipaludibacillus neizhouensis TaxID=885475 RepID=A0A3A9JZZ3_9BACI|nr:helix-turn-helix transcriptional regulator [Salipaludibacillus neizhouensis]RKL66424.1 transcriptional regulator [Salipaludibacillus neizhouensis]
MIGDNINRLRKQKGLTLTELAERANIAKSNLSNIERNINQNPSIKVLEKLAIVLDVELITVLGIKINLGEDADQLLEEGCQDLFRSLKRKGVTTTQLKEYEKVIEFIEWKNKETN